MSIPWEVRLSPSIYSSTCLGVFAPSAANSFFSIRGSRMGFATCRGVAIGGLGHYHQTAKGKLHWVNTRWHLISSRLSVPSPSRISKGRNRSDSLSQLQLHHSLQCSIPGRLMPGTHHSSLCRRCLGKKCQHGPSLMYILPLRYKCIRYVKVHFNMDKTTPAAHRRDSRARDRQSIGTRNQGGQKDY